MTPAGKNPQEGPVKEVTAALLLIRQHSLIFSLGTSWVINYEYEIATDRFCRAGSCSCDCLRWN